jgi:hypothetical protein
MGTMVDIRDDFDSIGFLKKQLYVIDSPHWRLNPAFSVSQVAKALSEASGKDVRVMELEALLTRHDIVLPIKDGLNK